MMDLDHKDPDTDIIATESGPDHIDLSNAAAMARTFRSFKTPSDSEIRKLKPGDFVKLSRGNERFWVRVSGFIGRRWHGIISNKLKRNKDLSKGDSIFFMRKNIYDLRRGKKS